MVTPFHGRHSWTPVCHSKHKTHAEADGFLHRRLLRERLNRMLGAARVDPTKVGLGTLKKINVSWRALLRRILLWSDTLAGGPR
jgi:hypothetical protein